MDYDPGYDKPEDHEADNVQEQVPVGADDIRLIKDGSIYKTQIISSFLGLVTIQ
jgi:hypothetical protein